MRESRTYGSVRGALRNERPYRDRFARNDGECLSRSATIVSQCGRGACPERPAIEMNRFVNFFRRLFGCPLGRCRNGPSRWRSLRILPGRGGPHRTS
jgi:hypothetical protein